MNPIDLALQSVTPTVMVPKFGTFEPLLRAGHRFLVAADGLWLEVRRPWVYFRRRLAAQTEVAMPYGALQEDFSLSFGTVPRNLVLSFADYARTRCPLECAAWVVWNEHTKEFDLRTLAETSVGNEHVDVVRPKLDDGEHLVVDLHSHGRLPAFFSSEDDNDDKGEVKISGVVGNCDQDQLTVKFRFCANGLFIPLPFSMDEVEKGSYGVQTA